MRPLFASLLLLGLVCAPCIAADVSFPRVWPQWHDADSFQSFYEYETGRELVGKWIVLRSRPAERGGLYFLTRVKNTGPALPGASFVIRAIYPNSTDTRVFTFPADVPSGSHLYEIGLTGRDWTQPRVVPVAWEVELVSADGQTLAKKTSFLWEKPPGR